MERRGYALLSALTLITLLHGYSRRSASVSPFQPLLVGHAFPATLTRLDGAATIAAPDCRVAFVVDPECGQCKRLAAWYRDSNASSTASWLSVGNQEDTRDFARMYDIASNRVFMIGAPTERSRPLATLGLVGVPTALILERGRVAKIQTGLSHEGPPFPDFVCSGEAPAPFADLKQR